MPGTGTARNKDKGTSRSDEKAIIAIGTRSGMMVYIPCGLNRTLNGSRFGGETGVAITTSQRLPREKATFTVLKPHGDRNRTRALLKHLLPQGKVDQLVNSCWGVDGARDTVMVRTGVVTYARSRLLAASNDPQNPELNPTPEGVISGAVRTWEVPGRRPITLRSQY